MRQEVSPKFYQIRFDVVTKQIHDNVVNGHVKWDWQAFDSQLLPFVTFEKKNYYYPRPSTLDKKIDFETGLSFSTPAVQSTGKLCSIRSRKFHTRSFGRMESAQSFQVIFFLTSTWILNEYWKMGLKIRLY